MNVLAIVVTCDAPDGGSECVRALHAQTVPPSRILVVDNASREPVSADALRGPVPVEVVRLGENIGPAGGYAEGLARFLQTDADCAWCLDDDVVPEPTCLAAMLHGVTSREFIVPVTIDAFTGEPFHGFGWVGVLLHRAAVERAGLPDARLFWGWEDVDYLRDRVPRSGFTPVRCAAARATVTCRPDDSNRAPWKDYYTTRNRTYLYLYGRRQLSRRTLIKSHVRASLVEIRSTWTRDQRLRRYLLIGRGHLDGALRRLGPTVKPRSADRPWGTGGQAV